VLARVRSAAMLGIDGYLVDVETDIANGLPTFATAGLSQGAVKEGARPWQNFIWTPTYSYAHFILVRPRARAAEPNRGALGGNMRTRL
jgi:hypothetical protein